MHRFKLSRITDPSHPPTEIAVIKPSALAEWAALPAAWKDCTAIVSGEALSTAQYGYATPLFRELGAPPHQRCKRLSGDLCSLRRGCGSYNAAHCKPGAKTPSCYEPPFPDPTSFAATVANLWQKGIYVLVVQGEEFNLISIRPPG